MLHDLARLKGMGSVMDYVVVRQDGQVMLHNLEEAEPLATMVRLVAQNCDTLVLPPSYPRFRHFLLSRECGRHLLVFPLGNYYLGVIQASGMSSRQAAAEVLDFVQQLQRH